MSLQGNGKGRLVLAGALVLALVLPQALVAKDGWDFTLWGSGETKAVTGMRAKTGDKIGNDVDFDAKVSFRASHDYGGVYAKLRTDSWVAKDENRFPIKLDEAYVWMNFLAPFGIAKDQADLKAKVGFFDGRATVASQVVEEDGWADSWGAKIEVGKKWLTAPQIDDPASTATPKAKIDDPAFEATKLQRGAVGQLDLKILDMVIWRSLVFLGDWNQHDSADITTGLLLDKLTLAEGHTLKASVSYTADLRDMTNSNYQLTSNTDVKTVDTLGLAAAYDGDLGSDMTLKARADVGFNNLVRWENDKAGGAGTTNADDKLKSNQMFIGWHGGVSFSFGDWVTVGLDLGGHSAQKAEYEFPDPNNAAETTDEIYPSQLIKYYIAEVSSSAVKAATGGDVMLNVFVRAVVDTTQPGYLLRTVEFGGKYDVVKSDEGNLWVKLGYGLAVEDPDNDGRYAYDTDLMKEETAGLYFKAGGDFKKMW